MHSYFGVYSYWVEVRYIFVRDVGMQGPVTYHRSRQRFVPLQGYQHGVEAVTCSDPYKKATLFTNRRTYKDV